MHCLYVAPEVQPLAVVSLSYMGVLQHNYKTSIEYNFKRESRGANPGHDTSHNMYYSFYKRVQPNSAFSAKHKNRRANLSMIHAILCTFRYFFSVLVENNQHAPVIKREKM